MTVSVLVPYREDNGWRDHVWAWVQQRWRSLHPDYELCVGTDASQPFSRAKARNDAFRKSTGDVLVIADADTICNKLAVEEAVNHTSETGQWSYPYRVYYNLTEEATKRMLAMTPNVEFAIPVTGEYEHAIPSIAGIFSITRETFETVGGYDEGFIGWGYEDNAFASALAVVSGSSHSVPMGFTVHLWHKAPESDRFSQPHIRSNHARSKRYNQAHSIDDIRAIGLDT